MNELYLTKKDLITERFQTLDSLNDIVDLNESIDEEKKRNDALQSQVTDMRHKITLMEQETGAIKSKLTESESERELQSEPITEMARKLDEATEMVQVLSDANKVATDRNSTLEEEMIDLTSTISTLEQCNAILSSEISLESSFVDIQSPHVEELTRQIEIFEEDRQSTQQDVHVRYTSPLHPGTYISDLDGGMDTLVEDSSNAEDMMNTLQLTMGNLRYLKSRNNSMKLDLDDVTSDNEMLQKENARLVQLSNNGRSQLDQKMDRRDGNLEMEAAIKLRNNLVQEIQDVRGNVRVFCRIRPPKTSSIDSTCLEIHNSVLSSLPKLTCRSGTYSFDHVFGPRSRNSEIYSEAAGVVELVLGGQNVCMLAYGQTGSGKTYTMDGNCDDPGVNRLALQQLFVMKNGMDEDVRIHVSVLEVYNGAIHDLLGDRHIIRQQAASSSAHSVTEKLQVRNDPTTSQGVHVPGLRKLRVDGLEDVGRLMRKAKYRRSVSSTLMNTYSSRSHLIVEVEVQRKSSCAKLHLVDLAGSERTERSRVSGVRLTEANQINKSLSALGNVFSALEGRRAHIPFRDSTLTFFLKNSLGGHAKTLMFITVSGDRSDVDETTATLKFGRRVRNVVTARDHNVENAQRLTDLQQRLRKADGEIGRLRAIQQSSNQHTCTQN